MSSSNPPTVILFGYHSSAFTQKVRMVLALKQIPYTWITVPSMMPRPVLTTYLGLTYRKIPVLAINRDIYCDTSLIIEALEFHPALNCPPWNERTIYPKATLSGEEWNYRSLARAFASYWVDRPFFRVTTGLIPAEVWRTSFGRDRAGLIGHVLDPDKLERKVPENLARMDLQLSLLEPLFRWRPASSSSGSGARAKFLFATPTPSLADIALYYQMKWGREIARGELIADLTAGGNDDIPDREGMEGIFTRERYPALQAWFDMTRTALGDVDSATVMRRKIEIDDHPAIAEVMTKFQSSPLPDIIPIVLPGSNAWNQDLDAATGVRLGARVRVAPDDTGMNDPIFGTLVGGSAEEIVVQTKGGKVEETRVHFPRIGFVVRAAPEGKARL